MQNDCAAMPPIECPTITTSCRSRPSSDGPHVVGELLDAVTVGAERRLAVAPMVERDDAEPRARQVVELLRPRCGPRASPRATAGSADRCPASTTKISPPSCAGSRRVALGVDRELVGRRRRTAAAAAPRRPGSRRRATPASAPAAPSATPARFHALIDGYAGPADRSRRRSRTRSCPDARAHSSAVTDASPSRPRSVTVVADLDRAGHRRRPSAGPS